MHSTTTKSVRAAVSTPAEGDEIILNRFCWSNNLKFSQFTEKKNVLHNECWVGEMLYCL